MMAVWCSSGALLLVLLAGVSYCAPTKKGFDPSTSYGGGHGAYPGSGGSAWEGSSHGYAAAAPVAGPAYEPVSHPEHPSAPHGQPASRPSAASSSSNSFAAPADSGYVGSFYTGPAQPDFAWHVPPPLPLSGDGHGAHGAAPEASGPSNVSPPGPPPPLYTAGELSQYEQTYEHGNSESESEEQGFQPPPPYEAHSEDGGASELQPAGPTYPIPYGWPWYMDYMFLTGQYPAGTVTHSSTSFEQGADQWHDAHYIKEHVPVYPSTQQVQSYPADFQAPEPVKQPSQPIKQGFGNPSFVQSGAATALNQPSGVHVSGSYSGPSVFVRQRQPAGSYGSHKVGY